MPRSGPGRQCLDDDERFGHWRFVGDGEFDMRLHPVGGDLAQAFERSIRQCQCRFARRQVDHTDVAPEDAATEAGAESLGAGFLGSVALGVGVCGFVAAFGL